MPFPTAEGQTLASAVESVPLHRVAR
jgi:hypothetical protein